MAETTINIQGKDVIMRYCAATETGFEQMRGRSVDVFIPKQTDGQVAPPEATTQDYIALAYAAIIAAYARKGEDEEPPVNFNTVLYDCTPDEIMLLMRTVLDLRKQWYNLSSIIQPDNTDTESEDSEKN